MNHKDLKYAIETCKPDFVFTIINEEITNMPLQNYLDQVKEDLGSAQLLLTGFQTMTPGIVWPDKITVLESLKDTIDYIKKLAPTS